MLTSGTLFAPYTRFNSQNGSLTVLGQSKLTSYYNFKTDTAKRVFPADPFGSGTAFSSVREALTSSTCTWTTKPGPDVFFKFDATPSIHRSQGVLQNTATSDAEMASMQVILRNKILETARARGVNLANMLGEYRQTADLFSDVAKRFVVLTLAVVHKDPRVLVHGHYYPSGRIRPGVSQRESKRLFNDYIAYVYGVKPLMGDLHEAMADIKSAAATKVPTEYFTEYTSRKASKTLSGISVVASSVSWTEQCRFHGSVKARARVVYSLAALNSTLGRYGLTNPLSVAWELTPWSFVYDWWFNYGEFLASLDNCLYIDGASSLIFYTTKRRFDSTVSCLDSESTYFNDARGRTAPVSLGTLATIRYKDSVSPTHIANGLALIGQKLSNIAIQSRKLR